MPFYEATLNFTSPTGDIKNVLHYDLSSGLPEHIQEATTWIMDKWSTVCADNFSPSIVFESITWRLDEVGQVGVEYTDPMGPYTGTFADADYAPNVALLVRKFHDSGSRPSRGRMYIGGVTAEALESTGRFAATNVDDIVNWAEQIRTFTVDGATETVDMVIKASNPTAANTQPYTIVNRVAGETRVKSQRRRLEGIGS